MTPSSNLNQSGESEAKNTFFILLAEFSRGGINADAFWDNVNGQIIHQRELEGWWVTTGLNQGGKKLLGPFATRDLALSVRTYMEMAETPATYWVENHQQLSKQKGNDNE